MILRARKNRNKILQYAKSKGYITPLWLLPNTDADGVQRAFQELESFLQKAYRDGDLTNISLSDVEGFMWKLKKTFAFKGWEGLAPYMLSIPTQYKKSSTDTVGK